MKTGAPGTWENWWVEDRKGKVVFKAIHSPGIFLRYVCQDVKHTISVLNVGCHNKLKNESNYIAVLRVTTNWLSIIMLMHLNSGHRRKTTTDPGLFKVLTELGSVHTKMGELAFSLTVKHGKNSGLSGGSWMILHLFIYVC